MLSKLARIVRQDDSLPIIKKLISLGYDKAQWSINELLHKEIDICDSFNGKIFDLEKLVYDAKYSAPIFSFSHVQCQCMLLCYSTIHPEYDTVVVDWRGSSDLGREMDRKDKKDRSRAFYNLYDQYREKYNEILTDKNLSGEQSDPESGIFSFDILLYGEKSYTQNLINELGDKILELILSNAERYRLRVDEATLIGDDYIVQIDLPLLAMEFTKEDLMDITWGLDERTEDIQEVMFDLNNIKNWLVTTQNDINNLLVTHHVAPQTF